MELQISDVFAGISCLVALIALVQSVLSGRKVKDLDLQLKQKELELHNEKEADAKKADVEVNMIPTAGRKLDILRFYNNIHAAINLYQQYYNTLFIPLFFC